MKMIILVISYLYLAAAAIAVEDSSNVSGEEKDKYSHMYTKDEYKAILGNIISISDDNQFLVYTKEKIDDLKLDWKGITPHMIMTGYNRVNLITKTKDDQLVSHHFYLTMGVWHPKLARWDLLYSYKDVDRRLSVGELFAVSDAQVEKQQLFHKFIDHGRENGCDDE